MLKVNQLIGFAAMMAAAAPAVGDIAVTRVALNTVTGAQDITIPGFGTPKAAIFITSAVTTDATATAHARQSFGATDGTDQWVTATCAVDNVTATSAHYCNRGATDEVVMVLVHNTGAVLAEANFDSWVTDGVRINVGATDGVAYLVTVILFKGADLSAKVGTTLLATQNNSVTLTPGFETNALIVHQSVNFADGVSQTVPSRRFGWASYDGVTIRQCTYNGDYTGTTSPTLTRGEVRNDAVVTFSATRYSELHSITSTEFQLRAIGLNQSAITVGYLALKLPAGVSAWAGVLDAPTATGDADFTSPAFEPSFALLMPTMVSAVNTDQTAGEGWALALSAITATAQYCNALRDKDAVTTTVSKTLSDDVAVDLDDHAGAAAFDATFVSFISTGLRLNFSDADGTVRKWPALFIG